MATKKKTKKKSTTKRTASLKSKPARKKLTKKRTTPTKSAKRAAAPKKASPKKTKKKAVNKTASRKGTVVHKKKTRTKSQEVFGFPRAASRSGEESGDLQGLSNIESADSESVDELIEEGNAFEAGVISGVEEAGDRGEREVRTREVPEDDVPGEYLDED
jgi:hypothetical protein